jgi:glycosyltransferase involved in cell wall biosynthesis/uncharacterized protein (UPF0147 family)
MTKSKNPCLLFVGTFPPRECGIATFTQDLTNAIDKEFNPGVKTKILAINDNGTSIYNYPRKVTMQINETDIEDYINRANEINKSPAIKLVNIQHEYGLFGGDQGEFLIPFLELLKKPVIITMHTVLPRPEEKMGKVGRIISEKSAGIIVMNNTAKEILYKTYGVKKNLIHVIPHGVHHVAFPSKSRAKRKLNLSGHTILSTFGMISCDKGIEYAIEALPEVIERYPNVLYLIIGATHPLILKREGEKYRNKLKRLIAKYKLEDNVKFYNRYLEINELIDYLKATDIYVYPMLSREQASSGSLSYALSCACPTIATASQYAKNVINHERGVLVRFRNSNDIKEALLELIPDKKAREEMKKNAYFYSRHMTWQNVALSYFKIFNEFAKIVPREKDKYPPIIFDHINTLTNKFGLIQFATHTKPDIHSGYCLDDNTRALLGLSIYYKTSPTKSVLNLINLYFNFIKFSQKTNGKFYGFVSYNKTYVEKGESEDSLGRAVWTLGYLISDNKIPEDIRKHAQTMLKKTIKWLTELQSLRAIAFTVLGLSYIAEQANLNQPDKKTAAMIAQNKFNYEVFNLVKRLTDKLIRRYQKQVKQPDNKDWFWFEDCLTYSNYKLPEALLRAHQITKNKEYLQVAEKTLKFLNNITFEKDYCSPIGQDGWYFQNGKRAYFDQQPEDTSSAVEALVTAYQTTKKKSYANKAKLAFEWFLGKNHLNQMVYDEATGGCYDGLGKYSINFNQGAESTISYLLARLTIENIK